MHTLWASATASSVPGADAVLVGGLCSECVRKKACGCTGVAEHRDAQEGECCWVAGRVDAHRMQVPIIHIHLREQVRDSQFTHEAQKDIPMDRRTARARCLAVASILDAPGAKATPAQLGSLLACTGVTVEMASKPPSASPTAVCC